MLIPVDSHVRNFSENKGVGIIWPEIYLGDAVLILCEKN
jgi:hypothetical protein